MGALSFGGIIERCLRGKNITAVVVGPAGVGKSTLVNTLMTQRLCEEGTQAGAVTLDVSKSVYDIPVTGGAATLTVYDSPGFTGDDENDDNATRGLEKTKQEVDVLLICFDLSGQSGRYMPALHGFAIKKIAEVFGAEALERKAVVVLTKCNKVSETSDDTSVSANDLVESWKKEFRKKQKDLSSLPVAKAGRVLFNADGELTHVSMVDGKTAWFNELWNTVAERVGERKGLAALMSVICRRQREKTRRRNKIKKRREAQDEARPLEPALPQHSQAQHDFASELEQRPPISAQHSFEPPTQGQTHEPQGMQDVQTYDSRYAFSELRQPDHDSFDLQELGHCNPLDEFDEYQPPEKQCYSAWTHEDHPALRSSEQTRFEFGNVPDQRYEQPARHFNRASSGSEQSQLEHGSAAGRSRPKFGPAHHSSEHYQQHQLHQHSSVPGPQTGSEARHTYRGDGPSVGHSNPRSAACRHTTLPGQRLAPDFSNPPHDHRTSSHLSSRVSYGAYSSPSHQFSGARPYTSGSSSLSHRYSTWQPSTQYHRSSTLPRQTESRGQSSTLVGISDFQSHASHSHSSISSGSFKPHTVSRSATSRLGSSGIGASTSAYSPRSGPFQYGTDSTSARNRSSAGSYSHQSSTSNPSRSRPPGVKTTSTHSNASKPTTSRPSSEAAGRKPQIPPALPARSGSTKKDDAQHKRKPPSKKDDAQRKRKPPSSSDTTHSNDKPVGDEDFPQPSKDVLAAVVDFVHENDSKFIGMAAGAAAGGAAVLAGAALLPVAGTAVAVGVGTAKAYSLLKSWWNS